MSWIRWSQWDRGGCIGMGQMPRTAVDHHLHEFGVKARSIMEETGADHVLYGVKNYDEDGNLEEVKFYLEPMTDEEFHKKVASIPGVVVYALHNRKGGSL